MNKCFYVLMLLFVFISLSGCAAIQQHQWSGQLAELNKQYNDDIAAEPKLKVLEGHVLLPPQTDWTLVQLADTSYPDAAQKDAVSALDEIQKRSHARYLSFVSNSGANDANGVLQIDNAYFEESENNRLALYQGKITFGEFNQYQKKLFAVRSSLQARLAKVTQEQQRQEWANALKSMSEGFQQAAENARANQPINTHCYTNGAYTNCTSN
jgi:hypothetical protein